jgi:hypothetical protein
MPDSADMRNILAEGYTKPELRARILEQIKAGDKGGAPGQWSARKAQMVAQEYERQGGGYTGRKSAAQKSLVRWTKQDWTTKSGKPSTQGPEATGERYLPRKRIEGMSAEDYAKTSAAKRKGWKQGKQFVPQPKSVIEEANIKAPQGTQLIKGPDGRMGFWRTFGGRRVFLVPGDNLQDALKSADYGPSPGVRQNIAKGTMERVGGKDDPDVAKSWAKGKRRMEWETAFSAFRRGRGDYTVHELLALTTPRGFPDAMGARMQVINHVMGYKGNAQLTHSKIRYLIGSDVARQGFDYVHAALNRSGHPKIDPNNPDDLKHLRKLWMEGTGTKLDRTSVYFLLQATGDLDERSAVGTPAGSNYTMPLPPAVEKAIGTKGSLASWESRLALQDDTEILVGAIDDFLRSKRFGEEPENGWDAIQGAYESLPRNHGLTPSEWEMYAKALFTWPDVKKFLSYGQMKESEVHGDKKGGKCSCWKGYERVPGTTPCAPGSCRKCDHMRKTGRLKESARLSEGIIKKPTGVELVKGAGGKMGFWRTVRGHAVFMVPGESFGDTMDAYEAKYGKLPGDLRKQHGEAATGKQGGHGGAMRQRVMGARSRALVNRMRALQGDESALRMPREDNPRARRMRPRPPKPGSQAIEGPGNPEFSDYSSDPRWRKRVEELENEGMTTSDAQAAADVEFAKRSEVWAPKGSRLEKSIRDSRKKMKEGSYGASHGDKPHKGKKKHKKHMKAPKGYHRMPDGSLMKGDKHGEDEVKEGTYRGGVLGDNAKGSQDMMNNTPHAGMNHKGMKGKDGFGEPNAMREKLKKHMHDKMKKMSITKGAHGSMKGADGTGKDVGHTLMGKKPMRESEYTGDWLTDV